MSIGDAGVKCRGIATVLNLKVFFCVDWGGIVEATEEICPKSFRPDRCDRFGIGCAGNSICRL